MATAGPGRDCPVPPVRPVGASSSTMCALIPGSGPSPRARLGRGHAWQWGDHDRAGFGLPPRVHYGAAVTADDVAVPPPGLLVDWFARSCRAAASDDRSWASGISPAPLDERADQCRRDVVGRHAVALDDLKMSVLVGEIRRALVDHRRRPVGEGPYTWYGARRSSRGRRRTKRRLDPPCGRRRSGRCSGPGSGSRPRSARCPWACPSVLEV